MSKLKYYYGTMGQGKSTMLLQMINNFELIGEKVLLLTCDRKYKNFKNKDAIKVESRIGLSSKAVYIPEEKNIHDFISDIFFNDDISNVLIDEIQFANKKQIDDLAKLVDNYNVNVFCFGLLTDFKSDLFEGSKRLIEIADSKEEIQLKSLCWCGNKAIINARVKNGFIEKEGSVVQIGDVKKGKEGVKYVTLCRKHYIQNDSGI